MTFVFKECENKNGTGAMKIAQNGRMKTAKIEVFVGL